MSEIIYGAESLGPRVRSVKVYPGHKMELLFSNGEKRDFDATPLLAYPAYKKLKEESFFSMARVEYGTVCWPGDIDCCPDMLYQDSRLK